MPCDLCGNSKTSFVCYVEGSEVTVCGPCSKFGRVVRRLEAEPVARKPVKGSEKVEEIVANFAQLIKGKRESWKMTQEDFAKKIQEKVTVLHKWETGHLKPDFETAKKLERKLGILLITKLAEAPVETNRKAAEGLTIGDILSV